MEYQSHKIIESRSFPGVRLKIRRISFGRRIELMRRVSELAAKAEFLEAGGDPREKLGAKLLASEIDRIYLEWGLADVEGLAIDGEPATPEKLVASGPEAICGEALQAIKGELGLDEQEEKN
ncbi:MAG: hypothetical protein ACPL88_10915 [Bryobacteraceae bacterium]